MTTKELIKRWHEGYCDDGCMCETLEDLIKTVQAETKASILKQVEKCVTCGKCVCPICKECTSIDNCGQEDDESFFDEQCLCSKDEIIKNI